MASAETVSGSEVVVARSQVRPNQAAFFKTCFFLTWWMPVMISKQLKLNIESLKITSWKLQLFGETHIDWGMI